MIYNGWTESEICMLYRQAKDKDYQIVILTQLTGLRTFEIERILEEGGYLNQMTDLIKERILELYKQELSDKAIGRELSVAQSQVSTFLRKQGLPPNGRLYNKKSKEDKEVKKVIGYEDNNMKSASQDYPRVSQDIKSIEQLENEEVKPVQTEVKNDIIQDLKAETKKNIDELKEILPKSIPTEVVALKDEAVNFDIVETLTPQQYYELAKLSLELLKTIWG